MKKILLLCFTLASIVAFSQNDVYDIFDRVKDQNLEGITTDSEIYKVNSMKVAKIRKDNPERIVIPLTREFNLELYQKQVVATGFKVSTSKQSNYSKIKEPVIYQGGVIGDSESFSLITIHSDNTVSGLIQTEEGIKTIGKHKNKAALIDESRLSMPSTNPLLNDALEVPRTQVPSGYYVPILPNSQNDKCKTVKIYFEVSNNLYKSKGSVQKAVDYVVGMFSVVSGLYDAIGVDLKISEIKVHTSKEKYSYTSSIDALSGFSIAMKDGFNGDLAHLLSNEKTGLGGVAYVGSLCASPRYKTAFSNVNNTFLDFPAWSWTINVVAHEIGHNLGSPHTHSCKWGTPLDNCYQKEGNCPDGYDPIGGGTIMSYCHLTKYGISFKKGFHPKVAQKIKQSINNADCIPYLDDSKCKEQESLPDLVRSSDNLDLNGDIINIDFAVKNIGLRSSPEFKVSFVLSKDKVFDLKDQVFANVNSTSLNVDEFKEFSISTIPSFIEAGEYYIGYLIDPANEVEELDENNNEFFWNATYVVRSSTDYCNSEGQSTSFEYIDSVSFGGNIIASGDNDGYGDFTNNPIRFSTSDSKIDYRLVPFYANTEFVENWRVWIDYNGNYEFEEEELVVNRRGKGAIKGKFTLPDTLSVDSTRMRVQMFYRSSNRFKVDACTSVPYGEVEDYTIIFNANDPCPNPKVSFAGLDVKANKSIVNWNRIDAAQGYFLEWKPKGSEEWDKVATDKLTHAIESLNFQIKIRSSCSDSYNKTYRIKLE